MNKTFEKEIKMIEDNKDKIARAICKAYGDVLGREEIEEVCYPKISKLVEDIRSFVVIVNEIVVKYEKDLNKLKEIYQDLLDSQLALYKQKAGVVGDEESFSFLDDLLYNSMASDEVIKKYDKMYISNINKYWEIGLSKKHFLDFAVAGGDEKVKELNSLINKIIRKEKYKDYKKHFSFLRELYSCSLKNKAFVKFYQKYKLENIEDLMNLLTEVNSFLIDDSQLNDEQREILEKNKDKFRERIGKDETYSLSKISAQRISKEISDIYENHLFDETFVKSNMGYLFEKYGIELNASNMRYLVSLCYDFYGAGGMFVRKDFGDSIDSYCFFNSDIFKGSDYFTWDTVIHEFLHSVEARVNLSNKNNFCFKYMILNELLTDYIAKFAYLNFRDKDLSDHSFDKEETHCDYSYAMPIIVLLRESSFWNELIEAKMTNNTEKLLEKINDGYLWSICLCINNIINSSDTNFEYNFERSIQTVNSIIEMVDKQNLNKEQKCRK